MEIFKRIPTLEEAEEELETFRDKLTETQYWRLRRVMPELYEDGHAVIPCVFNIERWTRPENDR